MALGAVGVSFGAGKLYIAGGAVREVSPQTGLLTTPAGSGAAGTVRNGGPAQIGVPGGVVVNGAGNLLIADYDSNRIRSVAG